MGELTDGVAVGRHRDARTTANSEARILETAARVETKRTTHRETRTGSCKTQTHDVRLFCAIKVGDCLVCGVSYRGFGSAERICLFVVPVWLSV